MTVYGGFNNSSLTRRELTEEEKKKDADNRERLCFRLRIYMGIQLMMAIVFLALGVSGAVFYKSGIPFFVGPFFSTPSFLLGVFGSYTMMKSVKDYKERTVYECNKGSALLLISLSFAVIGCVLGLILGGMFAFPICDDELYDDKPDENCYGYPTSRIIAIVTLGASGVALAVAIFSVSFLVISTDIRTTQVGSLDINRRQLVSHLQQLNQQLQQPTQGFANNENTQLARALQQLQQEHEHALQREQGQQPNFSTYTGPAYNNY